MSRRLAVLLAVAALLLLIVLGLRGREGGWGRPAPRPVRDSAGDEPERPSPDGVDGADAGPIVLPGEPEAEAEPEARIEMSSGDLSLGGVVRDEDGRALAGVEVTIEAYSVRHDLPARRVEIRTDEVGTFLFAGLHEGTYNLRARAPLRQGVYRRLIPAGTTDLELVLRAGAELVVGVTLPEGRAEEDVPKRLQVFLENLGDGDTRDDCDDARAVEFKSLPPGR